MYPVLILYGAFNTNVDDVNLLNSKHPKSITFLVGKNFGYEYKQNSYLVISTSKMPQVVFISRHKNGDVDIEPDTGGFIFLASFWLGLIILGYFMWFRWRPFNKTSQPTPESGAAEL